MIDPVSLTIEAIAHNDTARIPLVAVAGFITSIGPCVAPRYVAIAALLGTKNRRLTVGTFVAGMLTAYAALGFGAGVLAGVAAHAGLLDFVLAVTLGAAGLTALLRTPHVHDDCAHTGPARRPRRLSAVFSLGAASALVVSPCCTPIVAAVLGMSATDGRPLSRALLLAAFALGHAVPLFAVGTLGSLGASAFRVWNASAAPAVVSGTLMLALGAYYGMLV